VNRLIRQLIGFIRLLPIGLLAGDRLWGWLRLGLTGLFVLVVWYICSIPWEINAINQGVNELIDRVSILRVIPREMLTLLGWLVSFSSLRYLIIILSTLIVVLAVGARYIQDIYELRSFRLALQYLLASIFAIGYPRLTIEDGQMQIPLSEENLLAIIGGPGYLTIRPGNVVLFEQLNNPSNVRAEGWYFISRFESIKIIADLRNQHGYISELRAMTKDGVMVTARDIHYEYRLYASRRFVGPSGRSQQIPYPYSIRAVRNMTYNRSVGPQGITTWENMVRILFEGEIQDYIRTHKLDDVTFPNDINRDPRGDILSRYKARGFRDRLRTIGTELLWFGIGNFEVNDTEIQDQGVATWSSNWRGNAELVRAYGEAVRLAMIEQGRAEAQAEILMSIIQALQDIQVQDGGVEQIHQVFLARMAQLLDALGESRRVTEGRNEIAP
jgi:hypothetical protein